MRRRIQPDRKSANWNAAGTLLGCICTESDNKPPEQGLVLVKLLMCVTRGEAFWVLLLGFWDESCSQWAKIFHLWVTTRHNIQLPWCICFSLDPRTKRSTKEKNLDLDLDSGSVNLYIDLQCQKVRLLLQRNKYWQEIKTLLWNWSWDQRTSHVHWDGSRIKKHVQPNQSLSQSKISWLDVFSGRFIVEEERWAETEMDVCRTCSVHKTPLGYRVWILALLCIITQGAWAFSVEGYIYRRWIQNFSNSQFSGEGIPWNPSASHPLSFICLFILSLLTSSDLICLPSLSLPSLSLISPLPSLSALSFPFLPSVCLTLSVSVCLFAPQTLSLTLSLSLSQIWCLVHKLRVWFLSPPSVHLNVTFLVFCTQRNLRIFQLRLSRSSRRNQRMLTWFWDQQLYLGERPWCRIVHLIFLKVTRYQNGKREQR